jgi:ABC transport system ATP-binding/permease protein
MHNVGVTFNNRQLFDKFDYKFRRGERVGIVGANGAGKSTFLRLLTEELTPTTGKVVVGDTIVFGYYTQDGMIMKQDKRVIDVITDIAEFIPLEKGQKLTAAGLLERFLFSRDQQQVYVSQLSGGEKRRLYLLTIIMKNPNFLILDEPTNDLDIVTLNVLEDFLQTQFNGCLVIVTHDRYFMDKLVDHLFVFEGNGTILDHNGNYTEYRLEAKERERAQNRSDKAEKVAEKAAYTEGSSKTSRATDAERKEFKRLEKEIEKLESRKSDITNQFNDPSKLSTKDIEKLGVELGDVQNQLETKELRWLELSEMV